MAAGGLFLELLADEDVLEALFAGLGDALLLEGSQRLLLRGGLVLGTHQFGQTQLLSRFAAGAAAAGRLLVRGGDALLRFVQGHSTTFLHALRHLRQPERGPGGRAVRVRVLSLRLLQ